MSDIVEIIDLTSPKPPAHDLPPASDPDPTEQPVGSPSDQNSSTQDGPARKKRKRRSKRSSMNPNATQDTDARDSRAASEERQSEPTETRAKRKRERDEDAAEEPNEYPSRRARREERKERRREEPKETEREDKPDVQDQDLFFVDLAPAPISSSIISVATVAPLSSDPTTETATSTKLLVPAHVTVLGSTPVEIIRPLEEGEQEDEDFINYLDYEDSRPVLRYYNEAPDESIVLNRTVCKNCGAEGDHKTSACTVQICLTCGVRNEHSTRSCPISKICFTCGMKGHINANCPNRRTARALQSSRELECDRCSSSNHKTNECPTVWRLYEYFTAEEQAHIVSVRQSKKDLKVGEGGEGYVADDEWCYYCGQSGHWGDDCQDMDRPPAEHTAFSRYNVTSGPFYDPRHERKASTSRPRVRDWEDTSGWDKRAPDHVGKQGRVKARVALERQMQEAEAEDDGWFGNAARRSGASTSKRGGPQSQSQKAPAKGIVFGKSVGSGQRYAPPADTGRPSLLDRIGGIDDRRDGNDSRSRSSHHDRSHKRSNRDRDRDRDRDRYDGGGGGYDSRRRYDDRSNSNHYSDRRRNESGPRYRGGYVAR